MASKSRSKYLWVLGILLLGLFAYGGYQYGSASLSRQYKSEGSTSSTEQHKSEGSGNSGLTADGVNDFNACAEDIESYCSELRSQNWEEAAIAAGYTTASWKYALMDCFESHYALLDPSCVESLERRQALNEAVNTNCAADRGTYCRGVEPEPGSEPQIDCLMEHIDQVVPACAEALFDHEAAQALQ